MGRATPIVRPTHPVSETRENVGEIREQLVEAEKAGEEEQAADLRARLARAADAASGEPERAER